MQPTCRPVAGTIHVKPQSRRGIVQMSGNFAIDLLLFISYILTLYIYILIAAAVMSWLIAFNVINPRNQFVAMLGEFLYRITEPVLRPIRERLPNLGGIDISPIIVILIIFFIRNLMREYGLLF